MFERALRALCEGDLPTLGAAMEQSALAMHASMMAADPAVLYWQPATLAAMSRVRELRAGGIEAFFTMDAGPHVKVLTRRPDGPRVASALREVPGVIDVTECAAGPGAHEIPDQGPLP
jgi:diphosphomevalonate decarboxylase